MDPGVDELKDLLVKLNQDKMMFEKKLHRKSLELQRVTQSLEVISQKLLSQKHLVGENIEGDDLLMAILDQLLNQTQVQQLQEQARMDLIYYSKKIKQQENSFQEQKQVFETKMNELTQSNQILKAKLDFMITKNSFYNEALREINNQVSEVHHCRTQLNEKKDEDSSKKIAQLEARNSFLIEQVKTMETEMAAVEKLVTNLEQLMMQTKKRGK